MNFLEVQMYHTRPTTYFYSHKTKPTRYPNKQEHFGIELEFTHGSNERDLLTKLRRYYDYDEETGRYEIYYNRDGSIGRDGIELITQPHTITALKHMKWKKILDTINMFGYSSHNAGNCGMHVHASRRFFGKEVATQDRTITKIANFIDANWEDIVKMSRRTRAALDEWSKRYFDTNTSDVSKYKHLDKHNGCHYERYHAINLTNENTVEFRFIRGTLNYDTFMASIDFIYRIIVNGKVIPYNKLADTKEWLKGLRPETKEYLRQKGAFLDYLD